jgi:leader peptidase (prepilin peptidase)/N-methyltransferase
MIQSLQEVNAAFPWFFATMVTVFGACVGSFLNVVIYRVPAGKSVVHPGSHCRCGKPIAWYDNLPVLSWCLLRGKARCCKAPFSIRYPLVEAVTALLFWAVWMEYPPLVAIVLLLFVSLLIPAAMIDLDTMEIPDVFSIGGFVMGLLCSVAVPALHVHLVDLYPINAMNALTHALLGGFVGSGVILWIALVSEVILKKETMGFGDVKLLGAIGTFLGWQGAVFSLFGGAVFGTILLLPMHFLSKKKERVEGTTPEGEEDDEGGGARVPFGPALVIGAFVYLLFAHDFVDAYFAEFSSVLKYGG